MALDRRRVFPGFGIKSSDPTEQEKGSRNHGIGGADGCQPSANEKAISREATAGRFSQEKNAEGYGILENGEPKKIPRSGASSPHRENSAAKASLEAGRQISSFAYGTIG